MNRSIYSLISKSVLVVVWLLASGCQPAAQAPSAQPTEPEIPAETEAPATAQVEEEQPPLRVRLIQYDLLASGEQAALLEEASQRIGSELGISIETETFLLAGNPDTCNYAVLMDPSGFDISMQDSICSLHAFDANIYASVPDELISNLNFFKAGQIAFSDDSGALSAAPFGTSPMMIIYNPELLGELQANPSMDEVMEISAAYPLVIPPHGGIAMAVAQSYLTDSFSELDLLDADFYGRLSGLAELIDKMADNGQLRSASTREILPGFMNGEIAWTVGDMMFLRMLKMNGYDGPLALARLPQINSTGGSAMSIAWVVPEDSANQELAWRVVSRFAEDPQMIQWSISNGFVPFYDSGYRILAEQRGLAEPWLPAAILENDQNFNVLLADAFESTAWRLPASVPVDTYNDKILPMSSTLIANIANGEFSLGQGLDNWTTFLKEVDIQR
jgi:hypothetical protein